ncbi:hypothetical protein BJX66DRAFT_343513 [Aspergillus keveii]|uniref:DUF304 domain-containing protein n=1 Tax=Aspergillus keveii TaxID=714993 RepID=A0ABR4FP35_9EURO
MLRQRLPPSLTNAGILTIIWLIEFALDFVIENIAIRVTHGYGFAKTYGPLTLFAGKGYQFPIYESAFVASIGCSFTIMRWKASQRGYSPIETGTLSINLFEYPVQSKKVLEYLTRQPPG